jgi:hypothetical protein
MGSFYGGCKKGAAQACDGASSACSCHLKLDRLIRAALVAGRLGLLPVVLPQLAIVLAPLQQRIGDAEVDPLGIVGLGHPAQRLQVGLAWNASMIFGPQGD